MWRGLKINVMHNNTIMRYNVGSLELLGLTLIGQITLVVLNLAIIRSSLVYDLVPYMPESWYSVIF